MNFIKRCVGMHLHVWGSRYLNCYTSDGIMWAAERYDVAAECQNLRTESRYHLVLRKRAAAL
jgi:hypothetical protein